jgi:hypothetical protein
MFNRNSQTQTLRLAGRSAAGVVAAALLGMAPAAHAEPPVGDDGHTHHVIAGNGECKDIDSQRFHAEERGLHRGASSSGPDRGPWHGPC